MLGEPPLPPNPKTVPVHSRNCRDIYSAILLLCAGVRILASRTISMAQARVGQQFLRQYCLRCLDLGIHLVINHHLGMHYETMIKRFGPIYGWWLFAFERFNGMLEKVNHNGHDGGRMEITLLRNWVQAQLIYEYLISLPPDAHNLERKILDSYIKESGNERGGMLTQIAIFRSEASTGGFDLVLLSRIPFKRITDSISLPKRIGKPIDLRSIQPVGTYGLLLAYCRRLWPDLHLIDDFSLDEGLTFLASKSARALPYIRKDSLRYGSTSNRRTKADSYAFISLGGTRVPVEISLLLAVQVPGKRPHICAVVRKMTVADGFRHLPWAE
jgi:hypothetical protein